MDALNLNHQSFRTRFVIKNYYHDYMKNNNVAVDYKNNVKPFFALKHETAQVLKEIMNLKKINALKINIEK